MQTWLKTAVAVIGALLTAAATLAADPAVRGMLPSSWQAWLAAGGLAVLTGLATYFARNQMTIPQVNKALKEGDFTFPELAASGIGKHPVPPSD